MNIAHAFRFVKSFFEKIEKFFRGRVAPLADNTTHSRRPLLGAPSRRGKDSAPHPYSTSSNKAGAAASAKSRIAASASCSVLPLLPTSIISEPRVRCRLYRCGTRFTGRISVPCRRLTASCRYSASARFERQFGFSSPLSSVPDSSIIWLAHTPLSSAIVLYTTPSEPSASRCMSITIPMLG